MFVDLSAVAKGFGVDQVAASLESEGIDSYLVEVGGEVRVRGRATAERLWRLGIERPVPEERSVLGTLELAEAALATSGDYRNFRRTESGTISHTLDPRTGRPVARKTASVSVVRPTAAEADALATALCVLPHTEAIELATEKGWAVLLLIHTAEGAFESLSSPAWRRLAWRPAVPP
jgi:thiamine biosynthesis lipoprotein